MGDRPRICLVSASGQNVFFAEILEALGASLQESGFAVEKSTDCFPAPAEDLVYLFVPHEYHPLVHQLAHPSPVQLGRSVAVCTEQPGTPWFETSCEIAAQTGGAVDINVLGAAEMRRRGINAGHTPLGYVPSWDVWQRQEGGERPVDLVFLGGHTERRGKALARCAEELADRRAEIHLTESTRPHVDGSAYFLSRDRKWRLLAESQLILNVHRDALAYMEWHRVIGAILNGCVVLSEHSLGIEPLVPGEHFVSANYDDLHRVLGALLEDPGRLAQIRRAAYDLVREEMPVASTLEGLLPEVERAAQSWVGEQSDQRPTPMPMPVAPPAPPPDWEAYAAFAGADLPMRMALKHLVVHMRGIERKLDALAGGEESDTDVVDHLGPESAEPRVSVLLTVHNYSDYVGAAIRSVALGELREVEVVVVDDASTDDSVESVRQACAEFPWLPVTLVQRSRNQGLPRARNLALEHARADLLFILDADNAVLPQGLAKLSGALDAHPEAAFAYGVIETFDMNGPAGVMNWLDWDPERLRHGNYVDAMAMIRRTALEGAGGYSTDPALYGWEDFALWIALADAGMHGVRVPDFIGRYRVNAHSMISLANVDTMATWAAILRKHPTLAQTRPVGG